MNFEAAYRQLITAENLPAIQKMFLESADYPKAIAESLELRQANGLNYLYSESLDALTGRAGILRSSFIYCEDLVPAWKTMFYIPVLQTFDPKTYPFEKYLPYATVIQHELLHLRQYINLFNRDKKQIQRIHDYSLAASKPQTIESSMRYELEKIFWFETEAHRQDWDLGVRYSISVEKNRHLKAVRYDSKDKYLKHAIAYYIVELLTAYVTKFPAQKEPIRNISIRLIQELGKPLYGQSAYLGMAAQLIEHFALSDNPANTHPLMEKAKYPICYKTQIP
ncbi:MAG: hypothetical protein RL329_3387 [Bacteroidota bacterium]|jgi:hypothetical protein